MLYSDGVQFAFVPTEQFTVHAMQSTICSASVYRLELQYRVSMQGQGATGAKINVCECRLASWWQEMVWRTKLKFLDLLPKNGKDKLDHKNGDHYIALALQQYFFFNLYLGICT